jgi:LacI family transcriptional regulator
MTKRMPSEAQAPDVGDPESDKKAKGKPVTIYDVAEAAKVSTRTVSKVLNNIPHVSSATKSRVLAVIEQLDYRPNQLARVLATRSSLMLALLCDAPAAGSGYIARLQSGLLAVCQKEGYHLIVEVVHAGSAGLRKQVEALHSQSKLAGVVLSPPLCDCLDLIETLQKLSIPIVRISAAAPVLGVIDVDIDNRQAAYDMTNYLLGLGHRRIGFIRGPAGHPDATSRWEGFCSALSNAGISHSDELCVIGNYTYKSGLEAGAKLLTLKHRPTAIFASNDDMASGVMAASMRYDLSIPEDLSIAGFDDAIFAYAMSPRLTTCRLPVVDMAEVAINTLLHPGPQPSGRIILPHKIIIRGSTAQARAPRA